MAKKYIIRSGFVVELEVTRTDGNGNEVKSTRRYESGEELSLEDDDAKLHLHKLELASPKDRAEALAAEKAAAAAAAPPAMVNQADLVTLLAGAIAQALKPAEAAQAPAA